MCLPRPVACPVAVLALCLTSLVVRAAAPPFEDFIASARSRHGEAGERAARFLVEHMPARDRESLTTSYLLENLDLAFQARREFPWAASVPEEIFLNDVLPYGVFDETREAWRAELLPLARELVKGATKAGEAAQALNRGLFNRVQVHYNTGRKRPNQSLSESRALGKATCTGLSIILVNACRAVGIPARAVGTAMWTNERGNHTWVEVWDGDWHFTGADEPDPHGLDRGWFVGDASKARADVPRYAIFATSWKRDGDSFPMVWARASTNVAAVNVTSRYTRLASPAGGGAQDTTTLGVRLFDQPGGTRVVAHVCAIDSSGQSLAEASTKAGTADLNDLARLPLKAGSHGRLRFTVKGETRELPFGPLAQGEPTLNAHWNDLQPALTGPLASLHAWIARAPSDRSAQDPALQAPLTRAEATAALRLLAADRLAQLASEGREDLGRQSITLGDRTLRWMANTFGETPADGRSLWISMHGGGNAPPRVNDQQWTNQSRLYAPAYLPTEGIYLAPRAPTDTWNLWHEAHIDPLFQRLIDLHVALLGVNPEKVYLLGYSAGGDGVWQLAPRMADRFAAASMMAGHPNEASLLGLRNLPFGLFMGGADAAYKRNQIAAERGAELDRLAAADPDGYPHFVRIYEGLPHWMNRRDAEALPWMAQFKRRTWPRKIVWVQDDVVHRRFYWLAVPEGVPIGDRAKIVAELQDRTLTLTGDVPSRLQLRLSDALLDLDAPLTVRVNGTEVFQGTVPRKATHLAASLEQRADAASAASAVLTLEIAKGP